MKSIFLPSSIGVNMFGIQITEQTLPIIKDYVPSLAYEMHAIERFVRNKNTWFLISGYQSHTGTILDWAVLPEYILKSRFQYNPIVIQHDWDQIVRNEERKEA